MVTILGGDFSHIIPSFILKNKSYFKTSTIIQISSDISLNSTRIAIIYFVVNAQNLPYDKKLPLIFFSTWMNKKECRYVIIYIFKYIVLQKCIKIAVMGLVFSWLDCFTSLDLTPADQSVTHFFIVLYFKY